MGELRSLFVVPAMKGVAQRGHCCTFTRSNRRPKINSRNYVIKAGAQINACYYLLHLHLRYCTSFNRRRRRHHHRSRCYCPTDPRDQQHYFLVVAVGSSEPTEYWLLDIRRDVVVDVVVPISGSRNTSSRAHSREPPRLARDNRIDSRFGGYSDRAHPCAPSARAPTAHGRPRGSLALPRRAWATWAVGRARRRPDPEEAAWSWTGSADRAWRRQAAGLVALAYVS